MVDVSRDTGVVQVTLFCHFLLVGWWEVQIGDADLPTSWSLVVQACKAFGACARTACKLLGISQTCTVLCHRVYNVCSPAKF